MPWLRELFDRYDALSLRERSLVMAALLGAVALLWDFQLMGPLEQQRKRHREQITAVQRDITRLESAVEEIAKTSAARPEAALREQADRLRADIQLLDERLRGLTAGLIEPRQMTRVLEQLLAHKSGLRLASLRTLPPEAVMPESAAGTGADGAAAAARIFKHGVELVLDGSYLDTLRFLEALEGLEWRFYWDRIELAVTDHPRATIKLTLYTVSLQEGWIGV